MVKDLQATPQPKRKIKPVALSGPEYQSLVAKAKQLGVGPMKPGESPDEYWARIQKLISADSQ